MTMIPLPLHGEPVHAPGRPDGHDTALSLRRLSKAFEAKLVLDAIDLDIPRGQFLAVIGKSGCGKSTLLRLLAGLDRPTSGVVVYGADRAAPVETRIMFQEPRLLPWASVVDNVAVGLTGLASGSAARARALDILGEVGLADRQRRLALGAVGRPEAARRPGPRPGRAAADPRPSTSRSARSTR